MTVLVRNPAKDMDQPAELRYAAVPEHSSLKAKFDWLAELRDMTTASRVTVPLRPPGRHSGRGGSGGAPVGLA